jgi:hypothetical protein
LNGGGQPDVGPGTRPNRISGDFAKMAAVRATKKSRFFGGTMIAQIRWKNSERDSAEQLTR